MQKISAETTRYQPMSITSLPPDRVPAPVALGLGADRLGLALRLRNGAPPGRTPAVSAIVPV